VEGGSQGVKVLEKDRPRLITVERDRDNDLPRPN
jgi:hypothetical protein